MSIGGEENANRTMTNAGASPAAATARSVRRSSGGIAKRRRAQCERPNRFTFATCTRHAGAQSVGTEMTRYGPGVTRDPFPPREAPHRGKGTDERHYPTETDASIAAKTTLSGPRPVARGKLDPRLSTFVPRSKAASPRESTITQREASMATEIIGSKCPR